MIKLRNGKQVVLVIVTMALALLVCACPLIFTRGFVVGLVVARAVHYFHKHPLSKQIAHIIIVIGILIFGGLAYWTYSAQLRKGIQDQQIHELAELIKGQEKYRPERLLEKYPLGYVIYE